MCAVDESQLAHGERDILLRVVGDTRDAAFHLLNSLHQQIRVMPPQPVEDNWNGCRLGVQPQFEITGVVGGPLPPRGTSQ